MAIAQHSSRTQEHPTPEIVLAPARALLGGRVGLDPASTPAFNRVVRARRIYTRRDDGLAQRWSARTVFLNPPGGVLVWKNGRWVARKGRGPGRSSAFVWWDKLVDEYVSGNVDQAVFVGFTLEILRASQAAVLPVQCFARCYPKKRIAFAGTDPTHGNVIAWLPPPRMSAAEILVRMRVHFGHLGYCEGPGPR